jgi:hypothetical protein
MIRKNKVLEDERGSITWNCLENWFWKRLGTYHKPNYAIKIPSKYRNYNLSQVSENKGH